MQIWTWWLSRGYPVADAVEFMDRAQTWVRGTALLEGSAVRSFAFSIVFVPLFALARALELEDLRPLLLVAQGIQMATGLALVAAVVRLASDLCGRKGGLIAGALVGTNPVFLQYSVQPIAGIAAALMVTLGLRAVLRAESARSGCVAGLLFGASVLVAYKCLLPALVVLATLLLRRRWAQRGIWIGFAGGLLLMLAVQVGLDRFVYGAWGASLGRYVANNVGFVLARGLHHAGAAELARDLYAWTSRIVGGAVDTEAHATDPRELQEAGWYLSHLDEMFVWPVVALLAFGVWRTLARPSWMGFLVLAVVAANFLVLSSKGSKSFRLWLPLLAAFGPLAGWGWQWLATESRTFGSRALAQILVFAGIAISLARVPALPLRSYSGYWDAIEFVNEQGEDHRVRVASAYDWAVFLRAAPQVQTVKLPEILDGWADLPPERRQKQLALLGTLDWLILHVPILEANPALVADLQPRFRVRAAFYDQDLYARLGAVLVLGSAPSLGHPLFEWKDGLEEGAGSAREPRRRRLDFVGAGDVTDREVLSFLGFDCEPLPGSGWWWITYHWKAERPLSRSWLVVDRLTAPNDVNTWQNNHHLAWGAVTQWKASVLSEGYLLVPAAVEVDGEPRFRPLGGDYRRGDLIPVRLWMEINGSDGIEGLRLKPCRPGERQAISASLAKGSNQTRDGWRFSKEGLVEVGSFFLPVHPRARAPDDGTAVQE